MRDELDKTAFGRILAALSNRNAVIGLARTGSRSGGGTTDSFLDDSDGVGEFIKKAGVYRLLFG